MKTLLTLSFLLLSLISFPSWSEEKEGPWIYYWGLGELMSKGAFKNGKKEGRWVAYDTEGNLDTEWSGVFKNGVKISD